MVLNKKLIDGKQDLDGQERALNFIEQGTFAKVISYTKSAGPVPAGTCPNEAVLQDVTIGQQPGVLCLIALDVDSNDTTAIAEQLQAGKQIAFRDVAFVAGNEQRVLGFRGTRAAEGDA